MSNSYTSLSKDRGSPQKTDLALLRLDRDLEDDLDDADLDLLPFDLKGEYRLELVRDLDRLRDRD